MMKKIFLKLITTIISLYIIYCGLVYLRLFIAAKNITELKNQDILTFIIYGSSSSLEENTISGRFSILDSGQNEITQIERSWNGNYLTVDFTQIEINNKVISFPSTIYSRNRIFEKKNKNSGIKLEKYYNENKECILLDKNFSKKQRQDLYFISCFSKKKYLVPAFNINSYTLDLSVCLNDFYYVISYNESGKTILHQR
ncbi:MAG: hypothetical protein K6D95_10850 [Treponema sp.]|nr:hypothetical protein [Treponema sp.]